MDLFFVLVLVKN